MNTKYDAQLDNWQLGKIICRICLKEAELLYNLEIVRLEEHSDEDLLLKDILNEFLTIKINSNDNLPQEICNQCINMSRIFYKFRNICAKSDAILQSYLEIELTATDEDICKSNLIEIIETAEESNDSNEQSAIQTEVWTDAPDETLETEIVKVSKQIFSCKYCPESFEKKSNLQNHYTTNHSNIKDNNYVCNICNQKFAQAQTLARHSKIHRTDQKNKLCTFCGKRFMRSDDLKRHTRIHTGERPYACTKCSKKFKQSSELKEHLKTHSTEKLYICTECGKPLSTRNGLYVHMKVHRGEKKHECKICGKKYVTSGELTSHTKHIHSKVKPFACTYNGCDRAFVTKVSLKTHLHAHVGEKPFQCGVCNKQLATASSLHEHERIHTGVKPKQCPICEQRLGNAQALTKHMRLHTGERPYVCDICAEKFISKSSLNSHTKVKHKQRQIECGLCGEGFLLATKLREHFVQVHGYVNNCDTERIVAYCSVCKLLMNEYESMREHMLTHETQSKVIFL